MGKVQTNNYYLDNFDISSVFGEDRGSYNHEGVDFNLPGDSDLGMDIVAPANGTVVTNSYQAGGAGNYIVLEHEDGTRTKYFHMLDKSSYSVGDTVQSGDVIGKVGSTGESTGPHLHFEVEKDGGLLDPIAWLEGKEVSSNGEDSGGMLDSMNPMPAIKDFANNLIQRFIDFSFVLIPLALGIVLLLYTLYYMFGI